MIVHIIMTKNMLSYSINSQLSGYSDIDCTDICKTAALKTINYLRIQNLCIQSCITELTKELFMLNKHATRLAS